VFGSPEQFGAFSPAGDFVTVGRALSQHFLPLVAEISIANPLQMSSTVKCGVSRMNVLWDWI